jgi:hypothetical protein
MTNKNNNGPVEATALRDALLRAALTSVETGSRRLPPVVHEIARAAKRGAGTKRRQKYWSVTR